MVEMFISTFFNPPPNMGLMQTWVVIVFTAEERHLVTDKS